MKVEDNYDPISAGTMRTEDLVVHSIKLPPAPAGYWELGMSVGYVITRLAVEKKPPFVHRWFARILLGWKWIDAAKASER